MIETPAVVWEGPFAWPGFEHGDFSPIPSTLKGLYLQTFGFEDGYVVYCAGLTRRPVRVRLREHTRKYMNGEYTVLDPDAASRGFRSEVWHGWGYARAHRAEFELRKAEILEAARQQLAAFRIFVADPSAAINHLRALERLEAAVMASLYQQPAPFCDLPDRGMHLEPGKSTESRILVKNVSTVRLVGLPPLIDL